MILLHSFRIDFITFMIIFVFSFKFHFIIFLFKEHQSHIWRALYLHVYVNIYNVNMYAIYERAGLLHNIQLPTLRTRTKWMKEIPNLSQQKPSVIADSLYIYIYSANILNLVKLLIFQGSTHMEFFSAWFARIGRSMWGAR